jgi:hypothetical protein
VTEHTVTIDTKDHGPITIPEPAWCVGHPTTPPAPDGLDLRPLRSEIAHRGPSIDITVGTERGPARLIELLLWQDPFPTPACTHSDDVHMAVQLLDGHHFGYDADGLNALATDLMEAAATVRRVARDLAAQTGGAE